MGEIMLIDKQLLLSYGAKSLIYNKGDSIFLEGSHPLYYFQIQKGLVKIFSKTKEGKDFVYGYIYPGEPIKPFYLHSLQSYPFNAVAEDRSTLIRLGRTELLELLAANPNYTAKFLEFSAEELYYCNLMMSAVSSKDPAVRIQTLFSYFKEKYSSEKLFEIPYTRQQIASMTGLRVETVIRTVKQLEKDTIVRILKGKVYL